MRIVFINRNNYIQADVSEKNIKKIVAHFGRVKDPEKINITLFNTIQFYSEPLYEIEYEVEGLVKPFAGTIA